MVYIYLAPAFEEIEALTPADYLRRCGVTVKLVGVGGLTITGAHGIAVGCDCTVEEAADMLPDMAVLPGGMPGTVNLEQNEAVIRQVKACYDSGKFVAAICAAPSILGHLGLLEGRRATCFPGFEKDLLGTEWTADSVVTDGRIITSRGAGTANQFAFALVEALCGEEKADTLRATVQWE